MDFFIKKIQDMQIPNSILLKFSEPNSPPALVITINHSYKSDCVMFYGHLDKTPPLTAEWSQGKSPYKLVSEDKKFYGRGICEGGINLIATALMLKKISTETKGYLDRYVLLWETDKHSKSKNLVDWFK